MHLRIAKGWLAGLAPRGGRCAAAIAFIGVAVASSRCSAQKVQLSDGRTLSGKVHRTAGILDNPLNPKPQAGEVTTQPILVANDGLRRIYIPMRQVASVLDEAPEPLVRIELSQNVARTGGEMASIGPSLGISPFDEFGRRIYEMQMREGPASIIQGITEITPRYARVESLLGGDRTVVWDMRLATSSLPLDVLKAILHRWAPQDDMEARLQIVRFFVQAQRYHEARRELESIIADFPQAKDLEAEARRLRQMGARRVLDELKLRQAAGQYRLAARLLDSFPSDEVTGETLQQVRELIDEEARRRQRIEAIKSRLHGMVDKIADVVHQGVAAPVVAEISRDLGPSTVDRLAAFAQLLDDESLTAEQKTALAISGWILGPEAAVDQLSFAVSVVRVRDGVVRYLSEPQAGERTAILDSFSSMEGASVENVAKLVGRMKPPLHDPQAISERSDGLLELTAPGLTEDGDFRFWVQLPPEYDPYRRYPALLVLNGAYNSPLDELNFWAGSPPQVEAEAPPAWRNGQAMRHGYLVISVEWQKPQQREYEFSGREHAAILTCLRDALRRFSVDADRVFVTGHGIGGEAALDVAQSHPDLWAGAVPFVVQIRKYGRFYWENARRLPIYFVAGELDGQRLAENAPVLDRCLKTLGFDATIVEYLGRGHEPFHDETIAALDWMGRRVRGATPREFECFTMRPWDNYFWWIECDEFPENLMIHPSEWADANNRPASVEGKILAENHVTVRSPSARVTILLSPDQVDFAKPIKVTVGRRTLKQPPGGIRPDVATLLEDVRTRGDRQRPYWAQVVWP